jgi:hypothetical protein
METTLRVQHNKLEGQEVRETTKRLDGLRKKARNRLVDSLRMCNRYLFKTYGVDSIPPGGIYSGGPQHLTGDVNQTAIANWACQVVAAFFEERKK